MIVKNKISIFGHEVLAFNIFHIVFSTIVLIASIKTVIEALAVSNWALLALAGAEMIAVVLFVFPKLTKGAGIALMAIFLLAIVISLAVGIIMSQLHLIVYFICTSFANLKLTHLGNKL
jgi:hypothetical protein